MKRKKHLAFELCELAVILLFTAAAFQWGQAAALAERGYTACGGEYFLLLIPAIYYAGKRTILDWVEEIRGKVVRRP